MKINILMKRVLACAVCIAAVAMSGCEDSPPNDYVAQYVVQGYLIVDQPVQGITISRSQSVTDTFKVASGAVPDADVRLLANGETLQLRYRSSEGNIGEYYLPDTTVLVKPKTLYTLQITASDGATITAQTLTPDRFAWVQAPRDTVTIPLKNDPEYLNPPDSLDLIWSNTAGVPEYLVSVRSLDTAGYGKYLVPPTDVKNERINPDLDKQDQTHYNDVARWGFVPSLSSPIVWAAFKWYGRQEVSVYAADRNFVNWFKMTQWTGNAQFDPLLGNVQGQGIGIFGSAAVITKQDFVLRN